MKWEIVCLKDYTTKIGSGVTPKGGASVYQENGVALFRSQNIYNGAFIDKGLAFINEVIAEKMKSVEVTEGDVLLNITGDSVARCCYAPSELLPARVNQHVAIVRANKEKLYSKFLMYMLISPYMQNTMLSYAEGAGATRNALTKGIIEDLKIFLPPLPTQRKIASILSAYDDLIENNLKRIKLLEEKAFLRYKQIVREERLEEFTIEELANVVMGQSPTSDTYTNEKEGNLPFHQGVTNFSNYFVEHKTYCKAPLKIAEEGDILFSVRAPVGRINFASDRICIGRGLCAFRSKKGFQNYFYHQLKEFFFTEDVIGNGAIFNAVTKVELMKVKLKTPSEKIQSEFEVEAQQIYNLILNLTKQNVKLREARDILLPRLLSGQIAV